MTSGGADHSSCHWSKGQEQNRKSHSRWSMFRWFTTRDQLTTWNLLVFMSRPALPAHVRAEGMERSWSPVIPPPPSSCSPARGRTMAPFSAPVSKSKRNHKVQESPSWKTEGWRRGRGEEACSRGQQVQETRWTEESLRTWRCFFETGWK